MSANRFELLATWYLRFNGYFTAPNFTVHPDYKKQSGGTDADLLAVRFPNSEESQVQFNFERDSQLIQKNRTDFLICEVKSGLCDINNTWRDSSRKNVEYAIRWMGITADANLVKAWANDVYANGKCDLPDERMIIRFMCFGVKENPELKKERPIIQQILHKQVINFLRERFSKACCGIARQNWDKDIFEFSKICQTKCDDELIAWAKVET